MEWLFPFPGDFHILKNYQEVILKIFFEPVLKQITLNAGFRGEILTSLKKSTNYKRTQPFLFEEWEALYHHLMESFISDNDSVHGAIKAIIEDANKRGIDSVYDRCWPTIQNLKDKFCKFFENKAVLDPNWKFWGDFVTKKISFLTYVYMQLCALVHGT